MSEFTASNFNVEQKKKGHGEIIELIKYCLGWFCEVKRRIN